MILYTNTYIQITYSLGEKGKSKISRGLKIELKILYCFNHCTGKFFLREFLVLFLGLDGQSVSLSYSDFFLKKT